MDKKVQQQLKKMIPTLDEYQTNFHPLSALDRQGQISELNHQGITEELSVKERLFAVRKGKVVEIDIPKRQDTRFDYGDFRHHIEEGEPIQNHLNGDEEAVIIVRSEFHTKPKGPHAVRKTIDVFE
jgi:hypothetical protein